MIMRMALRYVSRSLTACTGSDPSKTGEKHLAMAVRNGNQIMVEIPMEKTSGGENTEWNLKKIGNEAVRIEKDEIKR